MRYFRAPSNRRATKAEITPQERKRQRDEYYQENYPAGLDILARVAKALKKECGSREEFLLGSVPVGEECLSGEVRPAAAPDYPGWEDVFDWKRGAPICPVVYRLLLQPHDGSRLIAISLRNRCLRGNPPVDVDHLAEEMLYRAWDEPVEPNQDLFEFCAATAVRSGQPVLVLESASEADKRKTVRRLTAEVRRLMQNDEPGMTPAG